MVTSESTEMSSKLIFDLGDCIIYWSSSTEFGRAYLCEYSKFCPPSKAWLMRVDSSQMMTGTLSVQLPYLYSYWKWHIIAYFFLSYWMNLLNSMLHEMLARTCFVRTIIKTVSNDADTILPYIWCSNIVSSLSCFRNFKLLSMNGVYLRLVSMYFLLGEGISWIIYESIISSSIVLTFGCSQISIWKL